MTRDRLDDRVALLRQFDQLRREVDRGGLLDSVDQFNRTALEILTADKVRQAFDLSQEDPGWSPPMERNGGRTHSSPAGWWKRGSALSPSASRVV